MAKFGADKYEEDYLLEYEEEIEEIRNERLGESKNLQYEDIVNKNSKFNW